MDNLLSGLGKYGLDEGIANNLFEDENVIRKMNADGTVTKEIATPKEDDFLLLKTLTCPICDVHFRSVQIKTGRAKRKEPDLDIRPRFEHVDTVKYDIASCPKCGFTAMNRYFGHLSSLQTRMIKEGVCDKLKKPPMKEPAEVRTYTYDEAIELYKLALYISVIKRGSNSEKAYTCLKIAWLLRDKIEELAKDKEKNKEAILATHKEYLNFYSQAFDGFVKAMSSENYPMCGMEQNTVDLLIAAMAYNLGKYDFASRFVSNLLVSRNVGSNIKNRAYDLKEKIIEKIKK